MKKKILISFAVAAGLILLCFGGCAETGNTETDAPAEANAPAAADGNEAGDMPGEAEVLNILDTIPSEDFGG